jgi:hypothetical protein
VNAIKNTAEVVPTAPETTKSSVAAASYFADALVNEVKVAEASVNFVEVSVMLRIAPAELPFPEVVELKASDPEGPEITFAATVRVSDVAAEAENVAVTGR